MRLRLLLLLLVLLPRAAMAQPADDRPLVQRIVAEFILPRYQALEQAMAAQQAAWQVACPAPDAEAVTGLQAAYQDAADAWSAIEFLHFGPIGDDFRHERMAHWPERRNAVSRALSNLLARDDLETLDAETFAGTSVAGQGLTALERLLFDDGAAEALVAGDESASRCAAGRLIARALAGQAATILAGWQGPDSLAATLAQAGAATARTALTRIATDMLSVYQIVGDLKLDAVMGANFEMARPALAEGRRSGRSTRAIVLNLQAAGALTALLVDPATSIGDHLQRTIAQAARIAASLPDDLGEQAADPARRPALIQLRGAVRLARDLSAATIPPRLGITVGFNSLDGD